MRILIFGARGQLGLALQRTLPALGGVVALGREQVDVTDEDDLRANIRKSAPDVVINAAAYTAVDKAESEPELANRINAIAPGIMAEEAKRRGAAIVSYSTEYVFDGRDPDPYSERSTPNPLSAYGRSKLAGDQAIAAAGAPYLIFRTSWVYRPNSCGK